MVHTCTLACMHVHVVFMCQNRGFASKKQPLPASPGLIIHIHGGGFVAQSPKTHEVGGMCSVVCTPSWHCLCVCMP